MRIDPPLGTRRRRGLLAACTAVATVSTLLVSPGAAVAAPTNLALSAVATASTSENVGLGPDKAIDGDPTTRWSSLFTDPQSLTIDLGAKATVDTLKLVWEASHATAYTVETSADGTTWTKVHDDPAADGGTDEIAVKGATVKLVRINGTTRANEYGYSLFEVEVLGTWNEQAVSLPRVAQDLREKGTGQVKVRLNKPATAPVSVAYATKDGTAVAGEDYVAASGRVTFAAGEVEKTFSVKGIDDTVDEPTETFSVVLSDPSTGTVAGPRTEGIVRITDDDIPPTDGKPKVVADFESGVVFSEPDAIFPFGSDEDDKPELSAPVTARDGAPADNHALNVKIGAEGWGGFTHNLGFESGHQDWSGYGGFRFWYKGMNQAPLPPGSGPRMYVEIKDGGANANASELWETSFTDDFDGWTLISVPFPDFTYRGDYQPVGGINQTLDLTQMWGYAFRAPTNLEATFAVDDVEAYGSALPPPVATLTSAKPAYPVAEGASATVGLVLTTTNGEPLDTDVQVKYSTGGGTAIAGKDYTASSGTLSFPLGTASGAVKNVTVKTTKDKTNELAETIDLSVTSNSDVRVAKDMPVTVVINAHGLPYLDKKLPISKRLDDLVKRMSLADKVGQMTQAERLALDEPDDIAAYRLGSLLSGGGSVPKANTPAGWADMIDGYQLRARQTALQIPLIYGVDAVHGHNNVVGATLFPHNIGLGATRDPALVRRVGAATAGEVRATGVAWDFSPCLCVAREDRWGRTYESFSEDPALVAAMATIVDGYEGDDLKKNTSVLSTLKHWVGDGGTTYGSSTTGSYTVDQGVTKMSEAELWRTQIEPYKAGIKAGSGSVMPSYSSVDLGDGKGAIKMHGHKYLITDVLKKKLGFTGFVISDWQAIDQIPGDYRSDITQSVNAGLDMIMVPYEYQAFESLLTEQVKAGAVKQSRIDDAVRRILRKKFELGLFENPYADRSNAKAIGGTAHRAVAQEAAAKSQTLLKNTGNLLPLAKNAKVYVAGSNADDIGNQSGGWSISWQGGSGPITTGTSILAGIKKVAPGATVTYSKDASADTAGSDVGVVVVGETPYAEGVGDIGNGRTDLSLSAADKAAVDKVCAAMKCAVLVVSGRPLVLDAASFDGVESVVAAWLPGTEGAGVAQPLFGAKPYTGRLPMTWARTTAQQPINVGDKVYDPQYAYGWGLRTDLGRPRLVAARAALAKQAAGKVGAADKKRLKLAIAALDKATASAKWWKGGAVRDEAGVLSALATTTNLLQGVKVDVSAQFDPIVSVARDVAQARLIANPASPKAALAAGLTATAEHELVSKRPYAAVRQFTAAWHAAR
jgi:beta-glucosidase